MIESNENPFRSPTDPGQLSMRSAPSKLVQRILFYSASLLILGVLIAMLIPARRQVPEAARRSNCLNNLRQLALAIQNYGSENGRLPPAYTVDDSGKPLHSWRTLILPYLELNDLYELIDLTKPWDDPVNEEPRSKKLSPFQCPSVPLKPAFTTYLANAWEKGAFVPGKGRLLKDFVDGAENTVLLFEVNEDQAVEWMSPQDGDYDTFLKTAQAGQQPHIRMFNIAMADGSVKSFNAQSKDLEDSMLPFFTIADGDKAEWPD